MVGQKIWIGVTIGVFVVGLLVSYALFGIDRESKPEATVSGPQMMGDTQYMQMMDSIMSNPEMSEKWLSSPQHVKQMEAMMSKNHDFMMQMTKAMMDNPDLRLQLLGHMTENKETMEQIRQLVHQGTEMKCMMNMNNSMGTNHCMMNMTQGDMVYGNMTHTNQGHMGQMHP